MSEEVLSDLERKPQPLKLEQNQTFNLEPASTVVAEFSEDYPNSHVGVPTDSQTAM